MLCCQVGLHVEGWILLETSVSMSVMLPIGHAERPPLTCLVMGSEHGFIRFITEQIIDQMVHNTVLFGP